MATLEPSATSQVRPAAGASPTIFVIATLLCVGVQWVVGETYLNGVYASFVGLSTVATVFYCFRVVGFQAFTYSTLSVLGFNAVTQSIPLFVLTLVLKPLFSTLQVPEQTFTWILISQASVLFAHFLYTTLGWLNLPARWLSRRVLRPLWIFATPTSFELWILGGMGLVTTVISRVILGSEIELGDSGGKFLQGFSIYVIAPFFIPFRHAFASPSGRLQFSQLPMLALYTLAVLLLSIATNQRALFSSTGFAVIFSTVLLFSMGRIRLSPRDKLIGVALVLASLPLVTIATNLSDAIQMARAYRSVASPTELVTTTLRYATDTEDLARFRALTVRNMQARAGYGDYYLPVYFLQRLQYTKTTDLTMEASTHMGSMEHQALRRQAMDRSLSVFPTPVLAFFGLEDAKQTVLFSTGDLYENLVYGRELGSFLTGSSITNAKDVFGWLAPVLMLPIFILIFNSADLLVLRRSTGAVLAPLGFFLTYTIFGRTLIEDGVGSLIDRGTRTVAQAIFLYVLLLFFAKGLSAFVPRRRRTGDAG